MRGQFDSQVDAGISYFKSNASAPGSKKEGTCEIPKLALNQWFSIEETCMRFSNTLLVISGTVSVKLPTAKYQQASFSLMVNTGSGNGLLTSGRRPLPEPRLTQSYVTIWRLYELISIMIYHIQSSQVFITKWMRNRSFVSRVNATICHLSLCITTWIEGRPNSWTRLIAI